MKKLFNIILIVTLPIIALYHIWKFWKFNFSPEYAYKVSENIDVNYHNPELVKNYFLVSQEVGTYARSIWKEHGVDLNTADLTDTDEKVFAHTYHSLKASAQFLEKKLEKSAELKTQGWSNEKIAAWEQGEKPAATVSNPPKKSQEASQEAQVPENAKFAVIAKRGDKNPTVLAIQQALSKKKHTLKVDGIFDEETQTVVMAFQQKKKIPQTGIVDIETFLKIMR